MIGESRQPWNVPARRATRLDPAAVLRSE